MIWIEGLGQEVCILSGEHTRQRISHFPLHQAKCCLDKAFNGPFKGALNILDKKSTPQEVNPLGFAV